MVYKGIFCIGDVYKNSEAEDTFMFVTNNKSYEITWTILLSLTYKSKTMSEKFKVIWGVFEFCIYWQLSICLLKQSQSIHRNNLRLQLNTKSFSNGKHNMICNTQFKTFTSVCLFSFEAEIKLQIWKIN